MKRSLERELEGGVYLYEETAWWYVLSRDWYSPRAAELSEALFFQESLTPKQLAHLLGTEQFFPLTDEQLGRWSLELRREGEGLERLPRPEARLALADALPADFEVPQFHPLVERIWQRLAPLLGVTRASNCLRSMLLPYHEWASLKPWQVHRLTELKRILSDQKPLDLWAVYSPTERVELFVDYMGPGRDSKTSLIEPASLDQARSALEEMTRIWCGRLTPPNENELQKYLRLALLYPRENLGQRTFHKRTLHSLLELEERLDPGKIRLVTRLGPTRHLPLRGIVRSELQPEEIEFLLEHEFLGFLTPQIDPKHARANFPLVRALKEVDFPNLSTIIPMIQRRDANRSVLAYIISLSLNAPPSESLLGELVRLFPHVGYRQDWNRVKLEDSEDFTEVSLKLGLERADLAHYAALRKALGKVPLSERFSTWLSRTQNDKLSVLAGLIERYPHNPELKRQFHRLESQRPDSNERKRCQKEVRLGLEHLPKELWMQHIRGVQSSLLKHILGKEIAESVPRVAQLLQLSDLPVDNLLLLRQQHPSNEKWLTAFDKAGHSAAHWLDGVTADLYHDDKFIELRTEHQPSEVLEMGTHFYTCLSLEDGFNAFSALTNHLEVNKMVLYGRDIQGKVMLRKLIAMNLKGEMVGYRTYTHLPEIEKKVHEACRAFAFKAGFTMSDTATPERIIDELDWHDDGVEPWIVEPPTPLPSDWPNDREALQEWATHRLSQKEGATWTERCPADYFHKFSHRTPICIDPMESSVERWYISLHCLAADRRYDILSHPSIHSGYPSSLIELLSDYGGIGVEHATNYCRLINPNHKVYRQDRPQQQDYQFFRLSPVFALAGVKDLRATCRALFEDKLVEPDSFFFGRLEEMVYFALVRSPEDQGWHRFEGRGVDALQVSVGTRVTSPCWAGVFRKATEEKPNWDKAWLARAKVESSKVRSLIEKQVQLRRHSLPLALALIEAGGYPHDFILPPTDTLLSPSFLVAARPLREIIEARLERLLRKGLAPSAFHTAKHLLATPRLEEWANWSYSLRDPVLDLALSREVLLEGRYQNAAAWVKQGIASVRLNYLCQMGALIPEAQRAHLSENLEEKNDLADHVTSAWLDPNLVDDQDELEVEAFILALKPYPESFRAWIALRSAEERVEILHRVSSFLLDHELERFYLLAFPKERPPILREHTKYFESETSSVRLQKLMLCHGRGELDPNLSSNHRGKWCREQLSHLDATSEIPSSPIL